MDRKTLLISFLICAVGFYWHSSKDPFTDSVWVNGQAQGISLKLSSEKTLTPDEEKFLDRFHILEIARAPLVWGLLSHFQKIDKHPRFLPYALSYKEKKFSGHSPSEADKLASTAGKLLEVNSYVLSSDYFFHASEIGGSSFSDDARSLWLFFSGFGAEKGGRTELAIQRYSKSVELNAKDYRASRQLGLIYYERTVNSTSDILSRTLARKYLSLSLKAKEDQEDVKKALAHLQQIELGEGFEHTKPLANGPIGGPKLPAGVRDPRPTINATPEIPKLPTATGNQKQFKAR